MNAKIIFGIICGLALTGLFFLGCQFVGVPFQHVIWGGVFTGGASISPIIFKYLMKWDGYLDMNN